MIKNIYSRPNLFYVYINRVLIEVQNIVVDCSTGNGTAKVFIRAPFFHETVEALISWSQSVFS